MVPADTDQLKVVVAPPVSPETLAVKVIGWPGSTSLGQLTVTVGHGGRGATQPVQSATVTVVEPLAVCWLPSFTSTVAVKVPLATPVRSQVTWRPSPLSRPPVTDQV